MNNEQSVKIYNIVATSNWTKATETELCGRGWKGQGRKGREGKEGTGIKEGKGGDGGPLCGKGVEKGGKGRE